MRDELKRKRNPYKVASKAIGWTGAVAVVIAVAGFFIYGLAYGLTPEVAQAVTKALIGVGAIMVIAVVLYVVTFVWVYLSEDWEYNEWKRLNLAWDRHDDEMTTHIDEQNEQLEKLKKWQLELMEDWGMK